MSTPVIEGNVPKWLTIDYIQDKLIKRYSDATLKVTKIEGSKASGKGENYTSCIVRIKVSHVTSTQPEPTTNSFVIKMTFQGDGIEAQILGQYHIAECEMEVYRTISPRFNALMKEIDDDDLLFASTLHVDTENSAIIFDDLVSKDFGMANRVARLDLAHFHLALRKLAKIHACGAVLNEREPTFFVDNKYDRGFYNDHTQALKPMMCGIVGALGRYVNSHPELGPKYGKKIEGVVERLMEESQKCFRPDPNHFMTFAHGDYWTNNMMFKYSKDQADPLDVCPLDWQLCVWGHPAIDLHYFFNNSLKEELRAHKQQELIKYYYDILAETLKKLKFKGSFPSLFKFNLEVQSRLFLVINASFVFQAIMLNTNTEHAEFRNLVGDDEEGINFRDSLFHNEQMQKTIELLLPMYDNLGLLDPLE